MKSFTREEIQEIGKRALISAKKASSLGLMRCYMSLALICGNLNSEIIVAGKKKKEDKWKPGMCPCCGKEEWYWFDITCITC